MLINLISSLGASALALGALTYLARVLIEKLLARDLAEHKARLDAQSQASIENLKLQTRLQAFEHEAAYQHVLVMRVKALADLYSNLVMVLRTFEQLFTAAPTRTPDNKLICAAASAWDSFDEHFDKNRIYLPATTVDNIVSFARRLSAIRGSFLIEISGLLPDTPADPRANEWVASTKAWVALKDHVHQSLKLLEEEFRGLLGGRIEIFPDPRKTPSTA